MGGVNSMSTISLLGRSEVTPGALSESHPAEPCFVPWRGSNNGAETGGRQGTKMAEVTGRLGPLWEWRHEIYTYMIPIYIYIYI